MNNTIRYWESPAAAIAAADVGGDPAFPYTSESRDAEPSRFNWQTTWDSASKLAIEGYPEGTGKLNRYLGTLARIRESQRPTAVWTPAGSAVDVGRYLAGEPDSMVEVVRRRRPSPVVKIAAERAVNCTTPSEEIIETGASVIAAVEALRLAGIPAEIDVTFTISRSGGYWQGRVRVQAAGMAVDSDVLAFWLVHPAALRRICFGLTELEPNETRRGYGFHTGGGYGSAWPQGTAYGDYDEVAPATSREAYAWLSDVLARRTGVEILGAERNG